MKFTFKMQSGKESFAFSFDTKKEAAKATKATKATKTTAKKAAAQTTKATKKQSESKSQSKAA